MFLTNKPAKPATTPKPSSKKETTPSIITRDINILGNLVSEGVVDFDGAIEGNIRCHTLTVRTHGVVKGEVSAENVFVYGKVDGLIRAKHVALFASCHISGIVMHESLSMEDGAFLDGKCKRTDKTHTEDYIAAPEDEEASAGMKMLENIRLIR